MKGPTDTRAGPDTKARPDGESRAQQGIFDWLKNITAEGRCNRHALAESGKAVQSGARVYADAHPRFRNPRQAKQ